MTTKTFSAWHNWLEEQMSNSSTMESELLNNAGPSAFQLQGIVLKSDKI